MQLDEIYVGLYEHFGSKLTGAEQEARSHTQKPSTALRFLFLNLTLNKRKN
jgi:hypothetical protein